MVSTDLESGYMRTRVHVTMGEEINILWCMDFP